MFMFLCCIYFLTSCICRQALSMCHAASVELVLVLSMMLAAAGHLVGLDEVVHLCDVCYMGHVTAT